MLMYGKNHHNIVIILQLKQLKKKKMWYIYTMEYYSAIKKNLILPFGTIWVNLESIILSEISQTEKDQYSYVATYLWILKIKQMYTTKQTHKYREQTSGYRGQGQARGRRLRDINFCL